MTFLMQCTNDSRELVAQLVHDAAVAVVIVDAELKIMWSNLAAGDLSGIAPGFSFSNNRLVITDPGVQDTIVQAVTECTEHDSRPLRGLRLSTSSTPGSRLIVRRLENGERTAVALIWPPTTPGPMLADLAVDWFGLTKRECQVALELLQGQCPDEIAKKFELKVSTVRTHIKHIHLKTRARGQGEVNTLLSAAAWHC